MALIWPVERLSPDSDQWERVPGMEKETPQDADIAAQTYFEKSGLSTRWLWPDGREGRMYVRGPLGSAMAR